MPPKKDGKEEEEKEEETGKVFKKTFTKKSKKIGRPVFFEDQSSRIDAKFESAGNDAEEPCVHINPATRSVQVWVEP